MRPQILVVARAKRISSTKNVGRDRLDQNFRKFRYKIEWNRKFLETHFENFGQPPEVALFSEIWKFREFPVPFSMRLRETRPPEYLVFSISFRPLQDLKDGGGRPFHQPYISSFVYST